MTIIKYTELDVVGYNVGLDPARQGTLELRWKKLTYDDTVSASEPAAMSFHRTILEPDSDVEATLAANKADMERQGFPWNQASEALDREIIAFNVEKVWTPEVKAAHAEMRAAERKRQEEANAKMAAAAARKLPKWKFWAALDLAGKADAVRAAVNAISDPARRVIVRARLEHTDTYDLDDPLFSDPEIMAELGMTKEDVDAIVATSMQL